MSHAELLEAIARRDGQTAAEMLAADPLLCVELDDPSAVLLALYNGLPNLAGSIAARRPGLTVFEAAAAGHVAFLERALAQDPDAARVFAGDGFTALHLSCFFGHVHAVALLLQAGADPRARSGNAASLCPLHSAAVSGNVDICRMLLHAGADPDAVQQGGYTALHAAALRGNAPLLELLLASGADVRLAAEDGRTAASIAHQEGFVDLARTLTRAA